VTSIDAFGRDAGRLAVGGIPVDRLADRVGGTPFFAYDRALLTARVAQVRAALPTGIELGYAIKANPMPAVVQHLSGLVDAFDVASADEMRTALDTPMPADRVSFAGPGKIAAELTRAVAAGVTIEVESATEAGRIVETGQRLGIRPRVAVRVNPDFAVKGSGMRMGGGPQQFGVRCRAGCRNSTRWPRSSSSPALQTHFGIEIAAREPQPGWVTPTTPR
jgi:diaminopimelate decarboxylase